MQIIAIFYLTLEVILTLAFVAAHIFSAFVELLCPPVKYLRKHFKIPSQGKPQSKNSTSAVSVRVPTPSESAAAPSPTMPPLPPPPCLVSRYHWPFVLSILFSVINNFYLLPARVPGASTHYSICAINNVDESELTAGNLVPSKATNVANSCGDPAARMRFDPQGLSRNDSRLYY